MSDAARPRRWRWIGGVGVVAVGAFALGHLHAGSDAAPAAKGAPPAPGPRLAPAIASAELKAAIAEAVRDELRGARVAPRGPEAETEAEAEAETETEAEAEAVDRAAAAAARGHAVVDAARQAGRWTRDDAAALRAVLPAMTERQRQAVLDALLPAFNRGELKPDYVGPTF